MENESNFDLKEVIKIFKFQILGKRAGFLRGQRSYALSGDKSSALLAAVDFELLRSALLLMTLETSAKGLCVSEDILRKICTYNF